MCVRKQITGRIKTVRAQEQPVRTENKSAQTKKTTVRAERKLLIRKAADQIFSILIATPSPSLPICLPSFILHLPLSRNMRSIKEFLPGLKNCENILSVVLARSEWPYRVCGSSARARAPSGHNYVVRCSGTHTPSFVYLGSTLLQFYPHCHSLSFLPDLPSFLCPAPSTSPSSLPSFPLELDQQRSEYGTEVSMDCFFVVWPLVEKVSRVTSLRQGPSPQTPPRRGFLAGAVASLAARQQKFLGRLCPTRPPSVRFF